MRDKYTVCWNAIQGAHSKCPTVIPLCCTFYNLIKALNLLNAIKRTGVDERDFPVDYVALYKNGELVLENSKRTTWEEKFHETKNNYCKIK